jgi:hypothetical protein
MLYQAIVQLKTAHRSLECLTQALRQTDGCVASEVTVSSELATEAITELMSYQGRLFREQELVYSLTRA